MEPLRMASAEDSEVCRTELVRLFLNENSKLMAVLVHGFLLLSWLCEVNFRCLTDLDQRLCFGGRRLGALPLDGLLTELGIRSFPGLKLEESFLKTTKVMP